MGKALYIESVADAAAIAGGCERLAAELGVSVDEVRSWSAGHSIPECAVFLRLIEIVLHPAPRREPVVTSSEGSMNEPPVESVRVV